MAASGNSNKFANGHDGERDVSSADYTARAQARQRRNDELLKQSLHGALQEMRAKGNGDGNATNENLVVSGNTNANENAESGGNARKSKRLSLWAIVVGFLYGFIASKTW